ncbi:histidine phosphatase family protein [Paenibacillus sp. H1-7]|uniref:histidine phosphatase family protein n=1 Tax=Paenibacillus sp. H1-7 TaxID=2282849 RepID=UPI001EF8BA7A|nr:histidine phosphatase family protein [Paenibacillus sp. H1-7]ULL15437.1 histidine phosphatase family protein [Paenibacillus sp. H1-7]
MEIVFVRHGEGEHTLSIPHSYHVADPGLTELGMKQAGKLREELPLSENDAVIVSPTRRTLQTAQIWCEGSNAIRFVHPTIGPRQNPLRYDFTTLRCDETMELRRIAELYSEFLTPADVPDYIWIQGINTVPVLLFEKFAGQFLAWIRQLGKHKVYIVTHDGTIASYLQYLNGSGQSRHPVPGEAGWIPLSV